MVLVIFGYFKSFLIIFGDFVINLKILDLNSTTGFFGNVFNCTKLLKETIVINMMPNE